MKVNGQKECYIPIRREGTETIISYGYEPCEDGVLATWHEVHIPYTHRREPSLQEVKNAVIQDINKRVKESIISGFVWNEKPVWLSEENQLNFSQAVVPATLKIGEQADGTPIYETFDTKTDLKAFNEACSLWRQQCLAEGYRMKDTMDWAPYEAYFPITTNAE